MHSYPTICSYSDFTLSSALSVILAIAFVGLHIYHNQNLPQVITCLLWMQLVHMGFTTECFLEVAIESWSEWESNPRSMNSVQTLYPTELPGHEFDLHPQGNYLQPHIYRHIYIYIYIYFRYIIYIYTSIYIYIFSINIYNHIYIYIYTHIYTYIYIYIYIYIYRHTDTHKHIHIYIHTHPPIHIETCIYLYRHNYKNNKTTKYEN